MDLGIAICYIVGIAFQIAITLVFLKAWEKQFNDDDEQL